MGHRVKAIFFDLGETLVTQNIEDNMVTKRALSEIAALLPENRRKKNLFEIYQRGYRFNNALRSTHHVEIPVHTWMDQLLTRALGRSPNEIMLKKAIDIIVKSRAANSIAFEEAKPILMKLSKAGFILAVISNVSSHEVAEEILKHVSLREYFAKVVTSAHTGIRKPDPGIFLFALLQFDLRPEQAIHVGDSEEHDIRGARAVGLKTVLVSRRSWAEPSLADYRVKSLAELPVIVDHSDERRKQHSRHP